MIAIMIMVVLIIYLLFVIAVSIWVYGKPEKVLTKWLASICIAMFLLFAPIADDITGEVYFKYLCATQGGIKVYQTVELGSEYFSKDGVPLFFDGKKPLKRMNIAERYFGRTKYIEGYAKYFNIDKELDEIFSEDNKSLGSVTYFLNFGGWLVNSTGLHVSGARCPSDDLPSNYIIALSKKVFIQKSN